jgi:acetyl-CoA carboxylase carboxyltransferase component
MWWTAAPAAAFTHTAHPALIHAIVVAAGTARAFEAPSLPAVVPAALFPRAAALSSSLFQIATILGPSIGGLQYQSS